MATALVIGVPTAAMPVRASEEPITESSHGLITQAAPKQEENDQSDEEAWRIYLDIFAFLPLETNSTTTINENSTSVNVPLSTIFNTLTGALTFKASAEYGRIGMLAAVNHAANSASSSASYWRETENPLRNQLGLPSMLRKRSIELKGDLDVDIDMNQTIVDLAMRYRAGAIQKPHMEKGSTSFVGFAGARVIDANLSTGLDFNRKRTVSVEGVVVNRERSREIERSASDGDFQESCHSLAAIQAALIKGSARTGSGSSVGLFIHTSAG